MTTRIGLAMLGLLVMARALSAHHTVVDIFDTTSLVMLRGTLASVEWKNPHVILHLDTQFEKRWEGREMERGNAENAQGLSQRGLNADSFKVGETRSMTVCVKRDGARAAVTHSIAAPNGDIEVRVGGCSRHLLWPQSSHLKQVLQMPIEDGRPAERAKRDCD